MESQEQPIKKLHPHYMGFFPYYLFGVILIITGVIFFLPVAALGLLALIIGETSRKAETFYLLDSGVVKEYKMFSTSRKFAEYHNIQNMEVNQSFVGNIFNFGNIKFDTSGSDLIEVSFNGVKDPYGIEKIVREKMKKDHNP